MHSKLLSIEDGIANHSLDWKMSIISYLQFNNPFTPFKIYNFLDL